MLVLGIILVLLAAALLLAGLFGGRPTSDETGFDLGGIHVDASTFGVFLMGAATLVIAVLGLWLIMAGLRRANRRRQEKKELNRLSRERGRREAVSTEKTAAAGTAPSSGGTTTAEATPASGGSASTSDAPGDLPATDRDQPKP